MVEIIIYMALGAIIALIVALVWLIGRGIMNNNGW